MGHVWQTTKVRGSFPPANPEQQCQHLLQLVRAGDIERDRGEAPSIRQMIETVATRYDIDRSSIFITRLSAGGAMANVMLATYPEVFAGRAIIAGLPYGAASTVSETFDRMRGHWPARCKDTTVPATQCLKPWRIMAYDFSMARHAGRNRSSFQHGFCH